MNAAARLVHQGFIVRQLVFIYRLTRLKLAMLVFTFGIVVSALGIVYMSEVNRGLYAGYQRALIEKDHLEVERTQLLLEESRLLMQSRIEQQAENVLGMVYPTHKQTLIIRK